MRAYSVDLRERVMKAYDEDKWTIGQIAERFNVGEWWVHKLKRQRACTGALAPRQGKVGKPRSLTAEQVERLGRYVDEHPDATLEQIREATGATCTIVTIHNTLRRLDFSYKKNVKGQRTRSR